MADSSVDPKFAISDAPRGGTAEFFWLAPTVRTSPAYVGRFDNTALAELAVEVCALSVANVCVGQPITRITSASVPTSTRLRIGPSGQFYEGAWQTAASNTAVGDKYRVSTLRNGIVLGFVDVVIVANTQAIGTVDPTLYTAIVKGAQFSVRFRLEQPNVSRYVRVNEVESNFGTPGDWVEFYNSYDRPLDVSGYVFRDNDSSRGYVLPAGSVIPGKGFLVLDESNNGSIGFGFGLGGGDQARLFLPDGTTLVDSYTWTSHATTTYGRCPDGSGAFTTSSISTKGASNDCGVLIRINEIESNGGVPADWVELYNPSAQPVALDGYVVRASDNARSYVIPVGTTIAANGLLVIDQAAFNYDLLDTDAVRLFRPNGTTLVDSYAWANHAPTSYGRCPNGTGGVVVTSGVTKGAVNNCFVPTTAINVNEVESSGGVPGDWVEFYNTSASPVDLSGYEFRDNDNSRAPYVLPGGTIVAANGYLVVDEAQFGFGLGAGDEARLFSPGGGVLVASHSWTSHAATTYGRCPNGTGPFVTSTTSTKGAANDCAAPVVRININEIESDGGVPGDWIELYNDGTSATDISGFILRDANASPFYTIPANTTIASGGYLVVDALGFGLGSADQARLFAADGVTLLDSYTWTAHASTTYGRCVNGSGAFTTTTLSTKGSTNACPGQIFFAPWSGDATVFNADAGNVFGGNMSGLVHEASGNANPGVLWAARNGVGTLFRLTWNGSVWAPDAANNWNAGKALLYPNGLPEPDAEGVTLVGTSAYVSAERNNAANGVSRLSILLYDVTAAGSTLTALREWNITADIPAVGPNLGLEGITYVPDAYLTANGFFDESANATYDPATYANHNGGLFFVGIEATGTIYAYALNHTTGAFTKVATIVSGFAGVMEVSFDREVSQLWAICDNTCSGRSVVLKIDTQVASPTRGKFVITSRFERPSGMPDLNNEGFAFGAQAECVNNKKPVYWADDSQTGGFAIRRGTVSCSPL